MGQVVDVLAELRKDNKRVPETVLRIYADALRIYAQAAANVAEYGAVCAHPKTGAPVENPYLKIQAAQGAVLAKFPRMNVARVWRLLDADVEKQVQED